MLSELLHGKRVGVYGRVSSEEQKNGATIDSQIEVLKEAAKMASVAEIRIYEDDGVTGATLTREGLDRLRDDAAAGLLDVVLVNDVDRLSRDVANLWVVKRDLESRNVKLIFRNSPTGDGPSGDLHLNVLASFAQYERQMIGDRTRRGKRQKAGVRQQFVGHRPCYGLRYVKIKRSYNEKVEGWLELVPEQVRVVKLMYRWAMQGVSINEITIRLNEKSIPSPKGKKIFARTTVHRILHDQTYTGVYYYGRQEMAYRNGDDPGLKRDRRTRPRETWLGVPLPKELHIIPKDMFDAVQRRLQRNRDFYGRNNKKRKYLLRGLIKCAICGFAVIGSPSKTDTCYKCSKSRYLYRPLPKKCPLGGIRCQTVDDIVWGAVKEAVLNPKILLDQIEKEKEEQRNQRKSASDTKSVEKRLQETEREEGRLMDALRIGVVSVDQLERPMREVRERKVSLEKELAEAGGIKPNLPESIIRRGVKDWCKLVEERIDKMDFEERKKFLQLLIDRIDLGIHDVRVQALIPLSEVLRSAHVNRRGRGDGRIAAPGRRVTFL